MRAVVITMARRADRQPNVEALRLAVPGIEVIEGVQETPARGWRGSAGAWGNREAHRVVLERALSDGVDRLLVFEDDARAVPLAVITELASRLPRGWEALMLGGQHIQSPVRGSQDIVRCTQTIRTHAYLLTSQGIATALASAEHAQKPWDRDLSRVLGQRRRTYAPDPFLVDVVPSRSDIPDSST